MPSLHSISDDVGMIFIIEPIMKMNIPEMDRDHSRLFEIIDDLNDTLLSGAIDERTKTSLIDNLFDKLIDYAEAHFTNEARAFVDTFYHDAHHHNEEHAEILRRIREIRVQPNLKMIDILKFLVTWLNDHILIDDRKFAQYYLETFNHTII